MGFCDGGPTRCAGVYGFGKVRRATPGYVQSGGSCQHSMGFDGNYPLCARELPKQSSRGGELGAIGRETFGNGQMRTLLAAIWVMFRFRLLL